MIGSLPCQVSMPGSPRRGTVQCRQTRAPVSGFEGGDETANAFVGAGDAGDDRIVDDERRHRAAVVLMVRFGAIGFSQSSLPLGAVQRQQVGVVGDEENLIAQNGDSAVGAKSCVANHAGAGWTRIVPKRIAGESVEGEDLVRAVT